MTNPKADTLYYGWKIVGALMFMLTFATGLSFYNHAVILNALAQEPAFTVRSASIAVSLFFLSGGVAGLWIARWVQEYDPRLSICAGALISGLSLAALALVTTVWQLYAVFLVFGVGFAASNLVPATTLVTRWFRRRRAMALSIASTGLSLGGVLITPLCALLVGNLGLAGAAPIMGLMYVLGVIPVALIFLRADPQSMGLQMDGGSVQLYGATSVSSVPAARVSHDGGLLEGITYREALRGRLFWAISLAYVFLMLAQVGGISHQYGLAREVLTEAQTAAAVAILPVASIVGRLVGGWVLEQVSIRGFAIAMMILQGASLLVLSGSFSPVSLCIGLAGFGITVGNLLMLQPLLIAEAYGVREYPRIYAISNFLSSWGTASGPAILGVVYTVSSSQYGWAFVVAAAAGLTGLCCFLVGGALKND